MPAIDFNCDMGESFGAFTMGDDAAILPYITSANIACGFHAGDPCVMRSTLKAIKEHNVGLGAHPSLPDLQGFGRREMSITPDQAYNLVAYQIGALQALATCESLYVQHVKPHGALYNMASKDALLAKAICHAIQDVNKDLVLYGLADSELTTQAQNIGLTVAHEIFADRRYLADGTLAPRAHPNAVIKHVDDAIEQALDMVVNGYITTLEGTRLNIHADTLCIHGDKPNAPLFAKKLSAALSHEGVMIKPFNA
ncbi:MAG: LamB/YcsF family protein [Pontibacterium sp.]